MTTNKIKENGVVFTPPDIVKYMTQFIDNSVSKNILEPSSGTGNFIEQLHHKHKITCIDINKEYIAECSRKFDNINCKVQNFIDFTTTDKFDYIIGNPPYVKIQNINNQDLEKMKQQYPEIIKGNTNLYIYFIIKCLDMLKDNGKLIFIVPNTWLYSKSFISFKNYIIQNRFLEQLIDFKDKQIFKNVSTYTCIIILSKQHKEYYLYANNILKDTMKRYYQTEYTSKKTLLKMMRPRIGIMTLKDDVFIIKNFKIKNKMVYFKKNNKEYCIERKACKNILKVSKNQKYLIIYPYDNNTTIIDNLQDVYPRAYDYLLKYKEELKKRDRGNKEYKHWYCYGRTQALKCKKGQRLFISTIVKNIKDFLIEDDVELYYSGLCIEPKNGVNINTIKKYLIKKERQILQNSNNKSDKWYSLSVNSFDF